MISECASLKLGDLTITWPVRNGKVLELAVKLIDKIFDALFDTCRQAQNSITREYAVFKIVAMVRNHISNTTAQHT